MGSLLPRLSSYLRSRWNHTAAEFRSLWVHYLWQSSLAAVVILIVLLLLTAENAVVVASIGATAFIIFTMPRVLTAHPRRVIGGHIIGLLCGSLCAMIPHASALTSSMVYALSVGTSIFLMVALDFEHPPASGTALGVAITGFSISVGLAVITSAVVLSICHARFKRFLKDLT